MFGVSSNLRHACAACNFGNVEFFNYDWKEAGWWNITFLVGSVLGGFVFRLLGLAAQGAVGELVTATVGAVLLLAVVSAIKKA